MFKIPGLRNVGLTARSFFSVSAARLRQVVKVFNRGVDVGAVPHEANEIEPLPADTEQDDLVAFLQALTDPRVMLQQAPFARPELLIPHGAAGDTTSVATSAPGVAAEREYLELPGVAGAGGATQIQLFPNNPFLPGFLQQIPAQGSFVPVTGAVPSAAPATADDPAAPAAPTPARDADAAAAVISSHPGTPAVTKVTKTRPRSQR